MSILKSILLRIRKKKSIFFERVIEKVINARDKVYAHKDSAPVEAVSGEELSVLIDFCYDTYNSLSRGFFNSTISFDNNDWKIDYVIKEMSDLRKQRVLERSKKR
jgi:hypothetical protein